MPGLTSPGRVQLNISPLHGILAEVAETRSVTIDSLTELL